VMLSAKVTAPASRTLSSVVISEAIEIVVPVRVTKPDAEISLAAGKTTLDDDVILNCPPVAMLPANSTFPAAEMTADDSEKFVSTRMSPPVEIRLIATLSLSRPNSVFDKSN